MVRVLPLLILAACAAAPVAATRPCTLKVAPGEVRLFGSLAGIMHGGKRGAAVDLADLCVDAGLVALGARADLDGEVTIVAGEVFTTRPGAARPDASVAKVGQGGAALLVAAQVDAWQDLPLEADVPADAVAVTLKATVEHLGLRGAFPFVIEGELRDLDWHVVDGKRLPAGEHSHEAHQRAALRGHAERVTARLIGFYSEEHEGQFTHRGEHAHMHVVLPDGTTGHVDRVGVTRGAKLRVPRR